MNMWYITSYWFKDKFKNNVKILSEILLEVSCCVSNSSKKQNYGFKRRSTPFTSRVTILLASPPHVFSKVKIRIAQNCHFSWKASLLDFQHFIPYVTQFFLKKKNEWHVHVQYIKLRKLRKKSKLAQKFDV